MNVTNNEQIIFKYILENPIYYKYIEKKFFENNDLSSLILIAKRFYDEYKEVPSDMQMLALVKDAELDIPDDFIAQVYSVDTAMYDLSWVKRVAESWIKYKHLRKNIIDSNAIMKMTEVTVDNVDTIVQKIVDTVGLSSSVDFNFDKGLDFFDAASHYQDVSKKITSGYKYIDTITGGYDEKTLVCYVGQSNVGKCVCGESVIEVRNKKTGEIVKMPISEFYQLIKRSE